MSNWDWKCECCLLFTCLLIGGPLGTQFYKIIQKTVEPSSGGDSSYSHNFFRDDDILSSSTLSLLVPSSLWFLVTTSCVGGFFWVLGEVLRKLHSATRTTSSSTTRSMDAADAASRQQRERELVGRGVGAGEQNQQEGRERELGILLEGGGFILEGLDNNLLIHHLVARGLIFLPHGRVRLWGISFL